jgi:hypothetical protein
MTATCRIALIALLGTSPLAAVAAEPSVAGDWETAIGRIRIEPSGELLLGKLITPSSLCGFAAGTEILRGTLLDDSLAGKVRVCLRGRSCRTRDEWASAVFLVASGAMSGAIHVEAKGCVAPVGKNGGLTLRRAAEGAQAPAKAGGFGKPAAGPAPGDEKKARRSRARDALKDGAAYLGEGSFETARRRFLEAIEIDDGLPEAFNGVGVTWRMRNDLGRALEWYKKAIVVDPDFGDAYYNMACVYALQGQKELALRYLQIAALNGYATSEGIDGDPDLEGLRQDPAYRALVRAKM